MAKTGIGEFIRQVRGETGKVTWPNRKETGITTLMVFLMVAFCMVFFVLVDQVILWLVQLIIDTGGSLL